MSSVKVVKKLVKNIDKTPVVSQIQKMIDHFITYKFIKLQNNKAISFGFYSETLKQIIKNEWLLTSTVFCDHPVFQFQSLESIKNLKTAFEEVQSIVNTVPFSFVEVNYSEIKEKRKKSEEADVMNLVKNQFKMTSGTTLKNQIFCSPDAAFDLFLKQQRERKIWWRKLSASPGRFHITQIANDESDKSQFVEIQAEFPWGFEPIEKIKYSPNFLSNDNFFEIKNQPKKFIPHVVSCETVLEKMVFTYLCDSFEGINEDSSREMLRFCRKLAPYKVSFAATGTSSEIIQNLNDLTLLLAKKIRKCGISVLLLPDVCDTSVEQQILRNDAIGIPYTILLNDNTLKDGIIEIRSRDTTLKEQSHVSLIVPYVEKLMKNY